MAKYVSLSSARLMFAIAPTVGRPVLSAAEERLLVGKARWIFAAARNGQSVCPTVVITRKAWRQLLAEPAGPRPLRAAWIAVLLKMVPPGGKPPPLVVRTASDTAPAGLASARLDIPPPVDPASAVDVTKPLARAIVQAFDSYDNLEAVWLDELEDERRDREIVLIQARVSGPLIQLLTRHPHTGELGPAPLPGQNALPPEIVGAGRPFAELIDAEAGEHMAVLLEKTGTRLRLVSARPLKVSATAMLEAMRDRVER
ncbi:MAG: hypothetical protein GXP01_02295, partial [Alphaproteobacteria bacterium]|nr:hypothetical protein [Alphaproteobacteria bacterium]